MATKKQQSITLDYEVIKEVEKRAKKEGRTKSSLINVILKRFFNIDQEQED